MIAVVATHQLRSFRRQRVTLVLLAAVVAMTAAAGVIGWSSHQTVLRVYAQAAHLLAVDGKTPPPNPLALRPRLAMLSNVAVYLSLVGGLMAMVLGHLSFADDESEGVGRLIFTRPTPRSSYAMGKLVATAAAVAAVLLVSLVVGVVAVMGVNGSVTADDVGRLGLFYALSWLYLMFFALVGMATTIASRRRSLGLLWALGVWITLTFAVPQFTSGLRPVASLNPVVDPVSTSQTFFRVTAHARPVSLNEQYKNASSAILATAGPETATRTAERVAPIGVSALALALLVNLLVRRHDYSRARADD